MPRLPSLLLLFREAGELCFPIYLFSITPKWWSDFLFFYFAVIFGAQFLFISLF